MSIDLTIQPECAEWPGLLARQPQGDVFGRRLADWREAARRELGLSVDSPIIATGHQTLLWHPGILAKYLVTNAFAAEHRLATANLIVDQHAEGFGDYQIPIRRADGSLAVRTIELCRPRPRKDVPMGLHEAFTPPKPPVNLTAANPSVQQGVQHITDAVYAHRNAPNAALQMARAITDLMEQWVRPMPNVTSTDLMRTCFAAAMMREMVRDPRRCAVCYNRAVAAVPEAGIGPLLVRDDYIELPLWRIRSDGRRMHAYDADVEQAIDSRASAGDCPRKADDRKSVTLLPQRSS